MQANETDWKGREEKGIEEKERESPGEDGKGKEGRDGIGREEKGREGKEEKGKGREGKKIREGTERGGKSSNRGILLASCTSTVISVLLATESRAVMGP